MADETIDWNHVLDTWQTWDQIEADPDFNRLSTEERLAALDRWSSLAWTLKDQFPDAQEDPEGIIRDLDGVVTSARKRITEGATIGDKVRMGFERVKEGAVTLGQSIAASFAGYSDTVGSAASQQLGRTGGLFDAFRQDNAETPNVDEAEPQPFTSAGLLQVKLREIQQGWNLDPLTPEAKAELDAMAQQIPQASTGTEADLLEDPKIAKRRQEMLQPGSPYRRDTPVHQASAELKAFIADPKFHSRSPEENRQALEAIQERIHRASADYWKDDSQIPWGKQTGRDLFLDKDNQQLLASFQATRNPTFLDAVVHRMTRSREDMEIDDTKEALTAGLPIFMQGVAEFSADPVEMVSTAASMVAGVAVIDKLIDATKAMKAGKVAKAVTRGATAGAIFSADVAFEGQQEVVQQQFDRPLATQEELAEVRTHAMQLAGVMNLMSGGTAKIADAITRGRRQLGNDLSADAPDLTASVPEEGASAPLPRRAIDQAAAPVNLARQVKADLSGQDAAPATIFLGEDRARELQEMSPENFATAWQQDGISRDEKVGIKRALGLPANAKVANVHARLVAERQAAAAVAAEPAMADGAPDQTASVTVGRDTLVADEQGVRRFESSGKAQAWADANLAPGTFQIEQANDGRSQIRVQQPAQAPDIEHGFQQVRTVGARLQQIAETGPEKYRPLAQELGTLLDEDTLKVSHTFGDPELPRRAGPRGAGIFLRAEDRVIERTDQSAKTGIHEAVHTKVDGYLPNIAATGRTYLAELQAWAQAPQVPGPVRELVDVYSQAVEELHPDALDGLNTQQARSKGGIQYRIHEFLPELYSNPKLAQKLNSVKARGKSISVLRALVDAVRRLIGLSPQAGSLLEQSLLVGEQVLTLPSWRRKADAAQQSRTQGAPDSLSLDEDGQSEANSRSWTAANPRPKWLADRIRSTARRPSADSANPSQESMQLPASPSGRTGRPSMGEDFPNTSPTSIGSFLALTARWANEQTLGLGAWIQGVSQEVAAAAQAIRSAPRSREQVAEVIADYDRAQDLVQSIAEESALELAANAALVEAHRLPDGAQMADPGRHFDDRAAATTDYGEHRVAAIDMALETLAQTVPSSALDRKLQIDYVEGSGPAGTVARDLAIDPDKVVVKVRRDTLPHEIIGASVHVLTQDRRERIASAIRETIAESEVLGLVLIDGEGKPVAVPTSEIADAKAFAAWPTATGDAALWLQTPDGAMIEVPLADKKAARKIAMGEEVSLTEALLRPALESEFAHFYTRAVRQHLQAPRIHAAISQALTPSLQEQMRAVLRLTEDVLEADDWAGQREKWDEAPAPEFEPEPTPAKEPKPPKPPRPPREPRTEVIPGGTMNQAVKILGGNAPRTMAELRRQLRLVTTRFFDIAGTGGTGVEALPAIPATKLPQEIIGVATDVLRAKRPWITKLRAAFDIISEHELRGRYDDHQGLEKQMMRKAEAGYIRRFVEADDRYTSALHALQMARQRLDGLEASVNENHVNFSNWAQQIRGGDAYTNLSRAIRITAATLAGRSTVQAARAALDQVIVRLVHAVDEAGHRLRRRAKVPHGMRDPITDALNPSTVIMYYRTPQLEQEVTNFTAVLEQAAAEMEQHAGRIQGVAAALVEWVAASTAEDLNKIGTQGQDVRGGRDVMVHGINPASVSMPIQIETEPLLRAETDRSATLLAAEPDATGAALHLKAAQRAQKLLAAGKTQEAADLLRQVWDQRTKAANTEMAQRAREEVLRIDRAIAEERAAWSSYHERAAAQITKAERDYRYRRLRDAYVRTDAMRTGRPFDEAAATKRLAGLRADALAALRRQEAALVKQGAKDVYEGPRITYREPELARVRREIARLEAEELASQSPGGHVASLSQAADMAQGMFEAPSAEIDPQDSFSMEEDSEAQEAALRRAIQNMMRSHPDVRAAMVRMHQADPAGFRAWLLRRLRARAGEEVVPLPEKWRSDPVIMAVSSYLEGDMDSFAMVTEDLTDAQVSGIYAAVDDWINHGGTIRGQKATMDDARRMLAQAPDDLVVQMLGLDDGRSLTAPEANAAARQMLPVVQEVIDAYIEAQRSGSNFHTVVATYQEQHLIRERIEKAAANAATKLAKQGKPVSMAQIRDALIRKLEIPLRFGIARRGHGNALGIMVAGPDIIRLRHSQDVETLAHEIGHYIHFVTLGRRQDAKGRPIATDFQGQFDAELLPLGQVTSLPGYTERQVRQEGVGEFLRYYLADPAQARVKAPQFTQFLESHLQQHDPAVLQALQEAQQMITAYVEQPETLRLRAQVDFNESAVRPGNWRDRVEALRSWWRTQYTRLFNSLYPIERVARQLEQMGMPPDQARRFADLAINYQGGAASKSEADVYFAQRNLKGLIVGRSLKDILAGLSGQEQQELSLYMIRKRADELQKREIRTGVPPVSPAQMKEWEAKYEKRRQDLLNYQAQTLQLLVDSGLISQSAKTKMEQMNRDYVPFYRIYESISGTKLGGPANGSGFVNLQSGVRAIKGSDRVIVDPIESIIKNTYLFRALAERNQVGVAFVESVESMRGHGIIMDHVATRMKPVSVPHAEMVKQLVDQGVIADAAEVDGLDLTFNIWKAVHGANAAQGEFLVWRGGQQHRYQVHDPLLYDALTFSDQATASFAKSLGPLFPLLRGAAQMLRLGATYTPDFVLRNFWRDQWTAGIQSKSGYIPFVDGIRGAFHVVNKTKEYQEWVAMGGKFSGITTSNRDSLRGVIEDLAPQDRAQGLQLLDRVNIVRGYSMMMEAINTISEEATRVGEYLKGRSQGLSALQAANRTKDVTINFARGGAVSRVINTMIPFFNVSMQDFDLVVRVLANPSLFKTPEGRRQLGWAYMRTMIYSIAPSVLVWQLGKDDDEIYNLPEWRRDYFWNINLRQYLEHKFPGQPDYIVTLPKPFLLGALGTLVERGLDQWSGRDPKGLQRGLVNLQSYTLFHGDIVQLPALFGPTVELAANYSFFTKGPITPARLSGLPAHMQFTNTTSEFAKGVSNLLAQNPNGPQISPIHIDHLIRGHFASLGSLTVDGIDAAMHMTGYVDKPTAAGQIVAKLTGAAAFRPKGLENTKYVELMYAGITEAETILSPMTEGKMLELPGPYIQAHEKRHGRDIGKLKSIVDPRTGRTLMGELRVRSTKFSQITKSMRMAEADATQPWEQRQARIAELHLQRNQLARETFEMLPESIRIKVQ